MFPVNFLAEKETFFEKGAKYCPHFIYKTIVFPEPIPVHTEYEELALKILRNSPPYPTDLPYLDQEEVTAKIQEYLDRLGLKDYVQIKF